MNSKKYMKLLKDADRLIEGFDNINWNKAKKENPITWICYLFPDIKDGINKDKELFAELVKYKELLNINLSNNPL